jgi:hypothetical protein
MPDNTPKPAPRAISATTCYLSPPCQAVTHSLTLRMMPPALDVEENVHEWLGRSE